MSGFGQLLKPGVSTRFNIDNTWSQFLLSLASALLFHVKNVHGDKTARGRFAAASFSVRERGQDSKPAVSVSAGTDSKRPAVSVSERGQASERPVCSSSVLRAN